MSGSSQVLHSGTRVQFESVADKNGVEIGVGDDVHVGAPRASDMHHNEFDGQIVDVYPDRGEVCVVDQDGDCFDVGADNVEAV